MTREKVDEYVVWGEVRKKWEGSKRESGRESGREEGPV